MIFAWAMGEIHGLTSCLFGSEKNSTVMAVGLLWRLSCSTLSDQRDEVFLLKYKLSVLIRVVACQLPSNVVFAVSITTIPACSTARRVRPSQHPVRTELFIVWNLPLVSLPSSSTSKFIGVGGSPGPCPHMKRKLGQRGQGDHEGCSGRPWPCICFMPMHLHGSQEEGSRRH